MLKNYDKIRKPFDLNGDWLLIEDNAENGMYFQKVGDLDLWRKITVPSDIATCYPERPYNTGVFWYRKTFTLDDAYASRRIVLHFDAVNCLSHIYLNGKYVGVNEQGFLPFDVDITEAVKFNKENELLVRVDMRRKQGQIPTSFYWKNYGGILRDVCIYSTDFSYIDKAHVEAHSDGRAIFNTKIVSDKNLIQKIIIKDADEKIIFETENKAEAELKVETKAKNISLWSVDTPTLYTAEISLLKNGEIIDKKAIRFGYRDIGITDGKICLNGKEIFLKGFNRHEDHPKSGGAACEEVVKADFKMIKESGANFIRMCHYPHDERELDEADELGLLLLVEIPLCAYMTDCFGIENPEDPRHNDVVYRNARENLIRMINRDRNHPSVIIWSVSNENNEPESTVVLDNHKALIQLAHKLDPTRPATHVSMHSRHPKRDTFFIYDDVICVNTYATLLGRKTRRDENYDFKKSRQMLHETISGLKTSYPGKPVIISEFGYCTGVAFDSVDDEKIQAEAVKTEFLAIKEFGEGASVWLFADHKWPDDPKLPGTLSTYGLLNRDRTKKEAYDVFCELLKQE